MYNGAPLIRRKPVPGLAAGRIHGGCPFFPVVRRAAMGSPPPNEADFKVQRPHTLPCTLAGYQPLRALRLA